MLPCEARFRPYQSARPRCMILPAGRGANMRRREFLGVLGGAAAAWPLAARAQQAMPVIGFLGSGSSNAYEGRLSTLQQVLKETGFVEGENVRLEYRWANDKVEQLPALAIELVRA